MGAVHFKSIFLPFRRMKVIVKMQNEQNIFQKCIFQSVFSLSIGSKKFIVSVRFLKSPYFIILSNAQATIRIFIGLFHNYNV